jgi:hypothetical protein
VKVIAWQGHKDGGKLILDTYGHMRPSTRKDGFLCGTDGE